MMPNRLVLCLMLATALGACGVETPADISSVECRLNSDCQAGEVCEASLCVDGGACVGTDCPCVSDGDCEAGRACDGASGECFDVECLRDGDCELGQVCLDGLCETDVDADRDRDGVPDAEDLCPEVVDTDQGDNDTDGQGDACDGDDDNDAVPDAIDNCPLSANRLQGDANGDGIGNACDPEVGGTTIVGRVDFSAGGDPNTELAQVFMTGVSTAVEIDAQGRFVFPEALSEPERFSITVVFEGFVTVDRLFEAPAGDVLSHDIGTLRLQSEGEDPELAAIMLGKASLRGRLDHSGILVRAFVGASAVDSALTDASGQFVMSAARVDHTLKFSKAGFLDSDDLAVVWDGEETRFEVEAEPLGAFTVELAPDLSASISGRLDSNVLEIADWSNQTRAVILHGGGTDRSVDVQPNGDFALSGIVPGDYTLDIDAEAHRRALISVVLASGDNDQGSIVLEAAVGEQAEVAMRGVATLAGLSDHSGTLVRALIGNNLVDIGVSDAEGNFVIRTGRADHTLEVSHQGFITQTHNVIFSVENDRFELLGEPLATSDLIELQPERNAAISGALTTPIEAFDFQGAEASLSGREAQNLVVQGNGRLTQSGLAPGLYTLSIEAPGHEPEARIVSLEPGDNPLGDIGLSPIRVSMLGMVVTRINEGDEVVDVPLESVALRLRRSGRLVATTLSDEQGGFVFPEALPVGYSLSVSKDNFISMSAEVEFDGQGFTLDGQPLNPETPLVLDRTPESDRDSDGVIDDLDNCPEDFNPDLRDIDADGQGDACDNDIDGDGLLNSVDNCPLSHNPMQEAHEINGPGITCSGGSLESPFVVGCGVELQHLNTRERGDDIQGSCGGFAAPEVVYGFLLEDKAKVSIRVESTFLKSLYVLDEFGDEVLCSVGGRLEVEGVADPDEVVETLLLAGSYRLVVDGLFGEASSGPLKVSISNSACPANLVSAERFSDDINGLLSGLAVADLNGDGHSDAATVSTRDNSLVILFGNDSVALDDPQRHEVGEGASDVIAADLNKNGFEDLVVLHKTDDEEEPGGYLSVLLSTGERTFSEPSIYPAVLPPVGAAVGLFDDDEHLDVAVIMGVANSESKLMVLLGQGDGTLGGSLNDRELSKHPTAVISGDLDLDGHLDLAIASGPGDTLSVLLGEGDGTFEETVREFQAAPGVYLLSSGDIDRDGDLDLLTANVAGAVGLLLGDGGGTFAPQPIISVGEHLGGVVLEDFDADGNLDIIVTSTQETQDGRRLYRGHGDGRFEPPVDLLPPTPPGRRQVSRFASGDFNNDGIVDLIAVGALVGNVLGNFSIIEGQRRLSYTVPQAVAVGDNPVFLMSVDIDENGQPDLLSLQHDDDTLSVLQNPGVGGLVETRRLAVSDRPGRKATAGAVGDIDEDGHLDMAFSLGNSSITTLIFGRGDGTFEPFESLTIAGHLADLALVDLNTDEHLDLIAVSKPSDPIEAGGLYVLLGEGDGTFVPVNDGSPLEIEPGCQWLRLGDLDDDGDLDAVTGHGVGHPVLFEVHSGQGGGSFLSDNDPIDLGGAAAPRDGELADLNNDGRLDLVMAHDGLNNISVRLGTGDGDLPFDDAIESAVGFRPLELIVADLDGNGVPDIVVTNANSDDASILLGRGDGTFIPETRIPLSAFPRDVAVGDFNRDEVLDLAFNHSNDLVTIMLHATALKAGTQLVDSPLSPCPNDELSIEMVDGNGQLDLSNLEAPCRIERLVVVLNLEEGAQPAKLTLRTPLGHSVTFAPIPGERLVPSIWSPEEVPELGRLGGYPLFKGSWSLNAPEDDALSGTMVIRVNPHL